MSLLNTAVNLLMAPPPGAAGYSISRSLRFNSSDSAFCSRTPASAGNRKTWTWAGWVKRSGLGGDRTLFNTVSSNTENDNFTFIFESDQLAVQYGVAYWRQTTQVFRDASAWYHIVLAVDTTQSVQADRMKIYVNGVQVTAFNSNTGPTLNADLAVNKTQQHNIGSINTGVFFNGYLADIYFIDGQALTPSSFTETDATTGQLIPKAYTGSYGTNGFHLEFADNSSNTATTLGKDTSGNGNNWTPNNLSVTAGAGNDSLVDVPTNGTETDTGVGGEVRGNYATWNPLSKASVATLSNGNLDASYTGSSFPHLGSDSTIFLPTSGKWYWEIAVTTVGELWTGIRNVVDGKQSTYYRDGSGGFNNIRIEASSGTGSANVASYTSGDVIGVAVNCDGSTIAWYKNGSQVGTTYSLTNVANLVPFAGHASTSGSAAVVVNFGARSFAYTAPSGFKALCTANLPAPGVTKPNTVMDVVLYTGTGSALTPTSTLGFNPDLVWIKGRSGATDHAWYDSVRGVEKRLESNTTDAEVTSDGGVTAFNSAGFSVGTLAQVNTSSATYAGWCWDAGTTTDPNNTAGSITSSVRANATAGFSIVTWTGDGSGSETIGHGLGVAPAFIIVKDRSLSRQWNVYHASIGATKGLVLNLTSAVGGSSDAGYWNNTSPTSTVFTVGTYENEASNYVAYCFAPVAGYSSFGSYVGNGSADGPFIYTGFRPKFILVKNTSVAGAWEIYDSVRNPYNVMALTLLPNASDAEITASNGVRIDFTSNGFKWRDNGSSINGSGNTIIWAAFAESPFQYARAR